MKNQISLPFFFSKNKQWIFVLTLLLIASLSCTLSGNSDTNLIQTQTALGIQMTMMAQQQSSQMQQQTSDANMKTQIAQDLQATTIAEQSAQLTQAALVVPPTQSPLTQPTQEVPLAPTIAPTQGVSETDIENKIKSAKILLYEDMAGTGELEYYKEALDMGGYKYKGDGSALGWFKEDLLGSDWDLIIAASENRNVVQGEFFQYLLDHINRGTGVIIEHWDLDDLSNGKVAPILSKCGIAIYRDWFFQDLAGVADLSVWPLVSGHPVFNEPNTGISLRNFNYFWAENDQGDLLKLTGYGDATMLAGNIATAKSDHGTLATCFGGRVIIQTFSSHTYMRDQVTRLIENYVHYTL
ncbi:MAG: hypothetical protein ACPL3P_02485, partial [Anaerolineales bacterium]